MLSRQRETRDVVKLLFTNQIRGESEMTPVMSAALSDNQEAFDMLVGMSADLTLIDNNQQTVLHFAILGGNTTIIDNLLPSFDIKIRKGDGRMVYCDRMVIFDMFIRKGPHLALADLVIQNRIYSKQNWSKLRCNSSFVDITLQSRRI